jgi:hypothetical protein
MFDVLDSHTIAIIYATVCPFTEDILDLMGFMFPTIAVVVRCSSLFFAVIVAVFSLLFSRVATPGMGVSAAEPDCPAVFSRNNSDNSRAWRVTPRPATSSTKYIHFYTIFLTLSWRYLRRLFDARNGCSRR